MLRLLNEAFQLQIAEQKLKDYGLMLGSDCPFFMLNQPCIATGRGELLQPIKLDLSNYFIVLVHPKIHVHTGMAFAKITPKAPIEPIERIIRQPVENWKDLLRNDFEAAVFAQYPAIGSLKETMYKKGAIYASMSGSGSSVYGLFKEDPENISFSFPKEYFLFQSKL
jgi:4-diphosphocytidyl-2-C-methyl-D-erythritol kinase